MKSLGDIFRNSIEYDLHSDPNNLNFLKDYELLGLDYDSSDFKIFRLQRLGTTYLLEVHRKYAPSITPINAWESDQYTYQLNKK